ncbi:membrane-bound PQQ-dependent dehydrogenase, glucose/quinate/shikimate family [Pseudoxanthomonas dokdonensis]|uniref:Glucose dehydrogenase n=1 Tax=Pseudoxanthomonas dokdonensis TaxID=344882 RepID=A0A0R0CNT1_9GAMM|nr:membrane-bound PQQ-dependent dehydrogenase, glucose/quinate/shikimate family [Pseudoxanthomonas dokdonensis]KRG68034.1 glucose dehydrogenase [Pseudoxanthomonas dokdonensis]
MSATTPLPLRAVAVAIGLLGTLFVSGGAWLAALGGSPYYLISGVVLWVSAWDMWHLRRRGVWLFWLLLVATVAWTWWESGSNYWRWVPRMDLMLALAVAVALVQWRLHLLSRRGSRWLAAALVACLVVAFGLAFLPHGHSPVRAASVPAVASADSITVQPAGDWVAYGRGYDALRYSPLQQIDKHNVDTLQVAWMARTGDLPKHRWGAETTPLKVGSTLYLCTARSQILALEATTGKIKWRFDPGVQDSDIPYTAACRGVAYFKSEQAGDCQERIIGPTLDGRLLAVDARSGQPCAGFGENGQVDITQGMGDTPPGYVSITAAPTIVRGVIVTGHQVLDGQRRWAPSGVIQGYDAVTGELRWAWDMLRPDRDGLPEGDDEYSRGTPNMWTTATADETLGLVYLPMGNSAADYWSGSRRPVEDKYATSLVALDVTTGKPRWNFQTTHIDVWDYDLGAQGTLIDFPTGNGPVPAIVLPSKQGDIYVLDRRSGRPLVAVDERPVPGGGVEPERRARTQPMSRYHTLRKPDLSERDMWGMTALDQLYCRIRFKQASYNGFYTAPESERHWIEYPGYNGGTDWGGIAIDPRRGIIVANYNDMPNYNQLVPRAEADRRGWAPREDVRGEMGGAEGAGDPQAGTPYAVNVNAGWRLDFTGLLCKQPPYGGLRAIELATGKTLWDRPFGSARGNGPFGIASHLPVEIGTPNNGGAVITASGLIFIAAATDNLIRAVDLDSGDELWHAKLPAGGQATPMVYSVDGRQYLVIVAAGHHFMETAPGDFVIAYALPAR